jgi:hypothetical protein
MTSFAPCADCSGEIIVGQFEPIIVPRIDEDGFPMYDADNRMRTIEIPLPSHRANTLWARQEFDPTGLAPAPCAHGLAEHPAGLTHPFAVSWIRAKYLDVGKKVTCPVCRGEPAPPDMTEALA